jgi:hypothetical protein
MLSLIVNDTEKITCPVCWAEVSTETFQRIVKEWEPDKSIQERNPVLLFSILTSKEFSGMLKNTDENLELAIYQCTAFVYNEEFRQPLDTDVFQLRGKLIRIPKKLENLTIEQNMHLRRAMANCKSLEELISFACAAYLQPLVDGMVYDHDRALELEKEILAMPIVDTFPIGFFFLSKLNNSGRLGLRDLNLATQKLIANVKRWLSKRKRESLTVSRT